MSGPVLFVASDRRECEPWVRKWARSRRLPVAAHWAVAGEWQGREVIAIANGVGPERAAAAVDLQVGEPAAVVSIGTCGALDPSLQIGDVFVPTEVRDDRRTWAVRSLTGPNSKTGPIVSVTRIAATASEKRQLRATGALAVEMESAGVARASELRGVPFYCVRAVSDLATEDFANNFNDFLMPDGRFNIPQLVFGAFRRPMSRIPELYRLAQRTALASQNMGEFLARCSF